MKSKFLKTLAWAASLTLLVVMGCKTTKTPVAKTEVPIVDTIALASTYHQSITSMSCQFNMQLLGNKFFSLSGSLQSVHNKELMVSVKALFGIEVVRIYCTPTRAVLIDRIGRRICDMPFDVLTPELGTDFYGLQGLLTNRLFDPDQNNYANFTLHVVQNDWVLTHHGKYQTEFVIQGGKFLQRSIIRSIETGDYMMATYAALTETDGILFPTTAQYVYYSKDRSNSVDVTFQRLQFNQVSNMNVDIPANYKTVTVEELKKQLLSL